MGLPRGLLTGVTARLPGLPGDLKKQPEASGGAAKRSRRRPPRPALPEETRVRVICIRLPLPPPELSPNFRPTHWAQKARVLKSARRRSADEAMVARLRLGMVGCFSRASLQIYAWYRDNRRRDQDNLIASCKAYLDGLVDGGILADDRGLVILPPLTARSIAQPSLLLEISRLA